MEYDLIVIGGGAAGVFAAISAKEVFPQKRVALIEKTASLLAKVRVSGGGRCNVTHYEFDLKKLASKYPRGHKELLGPFYTFGPKETIEWFKNHGVELKKEADGRMFPTTDSSQTIIDCLLQTAKNLGVEIHLQMHITSIYKEKNGFELSIKNKDPLFTRALLLATGSNKEGFLIAENLGHKILPPIPSLFTFNIPSFALAELSGVAAPHAKIHIQNRSHIESGPLLITHFGFSGPAALRLSAFEAPHFHELSYKVPLEICWSADYPFDKLLPLLKANRNSINEALEALKLPKRLLKELLLQASPSSFPPSNIDLEKIAKKLCQDFYLTDGKTTHKEEFVTCGGIDLKEVDFKTMQSKKCPSLFFAGEILNIDGITGGFNFQNAWTTGFIAGKSLGEILPPKP